VRRDRYVGLSALVPLKASPQPMKSEALDRLEEVVPTDGAPLDVAVDTLSHDASVALQTTFEEVRRQRRAERVERPAPPTKLTDALVAKLEDGSLPPRVAAHVRKLAGLELLTLTAQKSDDRAFRGILGAELELRYDARPTEVIAKRRAPELELRERNTRLTRSLRALLCDPRLSTHLRLECVERLGKFGDKGDVARLGAIAEAHPAIEVQQAAYAAMQKLVKANRMTIVLASMEARPYSGTGGLGNVMKELPRALANMGHRVVLLTPRHHCVDPKTLERTDISGEIYDPSGQRRGFGVYRDVAEGVETYFIDNDDYFGGRTGIYGDANGGYGDNHKRFDFFGAAIPQVIQKVLGDEKPDVVQLNDAHTATAAAYMRNYDYFDDTKTVMAVHNLGGAYQGKFGKDQLGDFFFRDMGLYYPAGPAEYYDQVNLMKLGLTKADGVCTVSREYMKEILTEAHGEGLHGVLRSIDARGKLWGNVNGIDNASWNPETDPTLAAPFSLADMDGKKACKADLQRRFGLPEKPDVPVIGVLGRLAHQKGWNTAIEATEHALQSGKDVQFVMCGQGDPALQRQLEDLAKRYPENVAFDAKFTGAKEHQIYGGSDFFLMPSLFEPCGLPQMYVQRYGTVPVVRAVGGLQQTIQDFSADPSGNGFKFTDDVSGAVDRALQWYAGGEELRQTLLRNCMERDYSWESTSAPEQLAFYREIMNG